jgi:hypothetical protein
MTLQYSLYLNINTPGKKIFHFYYYKLSVSHTERAYGAAIFTIYCNDAVIVLLKYRNSNSLSRSILLSKRQIKYLKILVI